MDFVSSGGGVTMLEGKGISLLLLREDSCQQSRFDEMENGIRFLQMAGLVDTAGYLWAYN